MLKRIKIRGKLLLLLATPLVAVVVFAFSGIIDRADSQQFQEREARIAELANAGSDLSLAIQVERIRVLEVERLLMGSNDLIDPERDQTDAQLERWLGAADAARDDLTSDELVAKIDDLTGRLPTTIAPDRGSDMVTSTLLASASRAIDEITLSLRPEASDLDLFRALTSLNELTNIQSSYATITSVGSDALFQGQLSAVGATLISEAERTAENNTTTFRETAERQYVELLERLENERIIPSPTRGSIDAISDVQSFIEDPSLGGGAAWLARGEEQLTSINQLIDTLASDATETAQQAATTAEEESQSFLILAGSVVLLAVIMAIVTGRSISRPLIRLTRSAEQLSTEELPALVESMRSAGRAEAPVLTPIEAKGRDEVAQLAHAIGEIQQVTLDVAEEQGDLLRRGISDIFVNLARRNQSLLDRQIDFIDQLESREENPDQLENLFRLDHLATRMRRNAESLLVLAGAEPTRRRGRPVEVVDVLRVAMGEIEDFNRIQLADVDAATVAGSVAVDLAHLMSELMENATQFSPPQADVAVRGRRMGTGAFQLALIDRGIGMSGEQLVTANRTLAEPPLVGLDLSRSLGFTVISRLAHRLGVSVELTSGEEGGVTALVTIPAEMVGDADGSSMPEDFAPPGEQAHADESDDDAGTESDSEIEADTSDLGPEPVLTEATPAELEADHPDAPPVPDLPNLAPTSGNPFGDQTPQVQDEPAGPATLPSGLPQRSRTATPDASDAPSTPDAPTDDGPPPPLPTRRSAAAATPAEEPAAEAPPTLADLPEAPAAAAEGDLFAAFGTPSDVPSAPADPDGDIFAPIDGGPSLPQRGETRADPVPAPEPEPTPEPAPVAAAPTPAPAPAAPVVPRDAAEVGAVPDQVTNAGLIRRTPKKVDVPEESKYDPGATMAAPQAASATPKPNRSPDEVRQMLSRYRAGLSKGRGPDETEDSKRGS